MGSGSATHNLRALVRSGDCEPEPWAQEFDDWLAETLEKGDEQALADYRARAPHARDAHPTDEHFLPLHVAFGAAGAGRAGTRAPSQLHPGKSVDGVLRVRVGRGSHAALASVTPLSFRSCSSSPVSAISRTMSQPPTNSPFT